MRAPAGRRPSPSAARTARRALLSTRTDTPAAARRSRTWVSPEAPARPPSAATAEPSRGESTQRPQLPRPHEPVGQQQTIGPWASVRQVVVEVETREETAAVAAAGPQRLGNERGITRSRLR